LADNIHFAFRRLPPYLAHLQPASPNAPVESRAA